MLNALLSTPGLVPSLGVYDNLEVWHDADQQAVWFSMAVEPRPCFTWDLVRDIMRFQQNLRTQFHPEQMRYLVYASSSKGVFSFGGDLQLFRDLIEKQDSASLSAYAQDCVTILYDYYRSVGLPLTTIALIEGDALGAGLEAALASDVVIVERSAKLGFPETLFNLVPGHGAYNLISRRIGARAARDMILGGRLYPADELHRMGLIDILVEDGAGRGAVASFIRQQNRLWNAYHALQQIEATCQRMAREELVQSATIWVEAALKVRPAHLRVMDRLIRAQNRSVAVQTVATDVRPEPMLVASAGA